MWLRADAEIPCYKIINCTEITDIRSRWPRGLKRGSAAARLLGLWVRIPPGLGCMSVLSVVFLGRGLCVGLITRLEEFYRVWYVLSVIIKPR